MPAELMPAESLMTSPNPDDGNKCEIPNISTYEECRLECLARHDPSTPWSCYIWAWEQSEWMCYLHGNNIHGPVRDLGYISGNYEESVIIKGYNIDGADLYIC